MATFKCKMCGGQLEVKEGQTVITCEFCGTAQTVPHFDNEKKAVFFKRAHELRYKCEFDKAAGVYETIVTEFPNEAEAYWGLVLCKYGIEYVDDPKTNKKIPTCHRTQFASIFEDHDYRAAIRNSDVAAREVYKREANAISKLQNAILEISSKEDPFDIFICYKETDAKGNRTKDSVLAQEIYDELISAGYKVFFARRTLERKLGSEYEPYIFAALHSAKVMVHVTTSLDNSESVWVRNEWSRFLSLITEGQKKVLIPCYENISAYDLPKELRNLQAQDMSKLGAMQDLVYGIRKIIKPDSKVVVEYKDEPTSDSNFDSLVRKGYTYLKNHKIEAANRCFEKAVEETELCGEAYIGILLCKYQLDSLDALLEQSDLSILEDENFKLAHEFANKACAEILRNIEDSIRRNEKLNRYKKAKQYLDGNNPESYKIALDMFTELGDFEDSETLKQECEYRCGVYYFRLIKTINDIGNANSSKYHFSAVPGYKDSDMMGDKIDAHVASIKEQHIKDCVSKLEISLIGEFTLEQADRIVNKIVNNRRTVNTFKPSFEEINKANLEFEQNSKKFIGDKCPDLITSFDSLGQCSSLRRILEKCEISNEFAQTKELISQREKEIKEKQAIIRKKRTRKTITITSIVCAALVVCVATGFGVKAIVDENKRNATYNSANQAMVSGDYDDAIAYYESLGNYHESQKKIKVCEGLKQLQVSIDSKKEADAIQGIKMIVGAGEKVEVNYEAKEGNIKRNRLNLLAEATNENKTEIIDNVDFTLYKPENNGYTFLNWNSKAVSYTNDLVHLSLLSNWSLNKYNISYNLDGGTNNSQNPSSYSIEDGDISFLPPSKTGYTFVNWTDKDGNPIAKVNNGFTGDITLNANWKANKYTITLNANGGSVAQTSLEVTYDEPYSLPIPTRSYYGFTGWFDGDNIITDGIWKQTTNITIKAKWNADSYTINYVLDGGTNSSNNPSSYTIEDSVIFSSPTRTGYHFDGWFDDGGQPITGLPVGSHGNITIYAHWTINSYTVTFKNYDGTTLDTQTVTHGSNATYGGETPTKPKTAQYTYTFTGWDKPLTNIISDTVITAQFGSTVNKYTIIWKNYDGTVLKTDELEYGSMPAFNGVTPSKPSTLEKYYIFTGWSPLIETVTKDEIYVAQFSENDTFEFEYDDTISGGTYNVITKCNLNNVDCIQVPEVLGGNEIRRIKAGAFSNCSNVKEIIVPSSVYYIDKGAFAGCSNLEKITLPHVGNSGTTNAGSTDNVQETDLFGYIFGNSQFDNSTKYTYTCGYTTAYTVNVFIPKNLKTVVIDSDNLGIGVGARAFANIEEIENVSLIGYTKFVGNESFVGCKGLKSLTLGENVKRICVAGFAYCSSIENIVINDGLEVIETEAFAHCSSLKYVYLPDSLTSINTAAFYNCQSLKEMNLPFAGSNRDPSQSFQCFGNMFGFNNGASSTYFYQAKQAYSDDSEYTLENGTTFTLPISLKKVTIRDDYNCAFAFNKLHIEEVEFTNLTVLKKYTFYRSSIKKLVLPEVTDISTGACQWTSSLQEVYAPKLKQVFSNAFDQSGLLYYDQDFLANSQIEYLGPQSFCHCPGGNTIEYLILPSSLTQLSNLVFGAGNGGGYDNLRTFYYMGTKEQWNTLMTNSSTNWTYYSSYTVYYYAETQPIVPDNYWHYVDGVPEKWNYGDGSETNPYTVLAARDVIHSISSQGYTGPMYVEGVVSSVRRDDVFDYIQFKVLDDTVELEVREVGFDKGTLGEELANYYSNNLEALIGKTVTLRGIGFNDLSGVATILPAWSVGIYYIPTIYSIK